VGFCYQRLSIDEAGASYCLHGLNAVHLPEFGWYRVDSRGNNLGISAQFSPPAEQLHFGRVLQRKGTFRKYCLFRLPVVVAALQRYSTWDALYKNLPDWDFPSLPGSTASWCAHAESS